MLFRSQHLDAGANQDVMFGYAEFVTLENSVSITGDSGPTTIVFANTKEILVEKFITLKKVDELTGEVLPGVSFEIYAVGDPSDTLISFTAGAELGEYVYTSSSGVTTLTTNASGEVVLEDLPAGDYYFLETQTVSGYILPTGEDAKKFFTITAGGSVGSTSGNSSVVPIAGASSYQYNSGITYTMNTTIPSDGHGPWRFQLGYGSGSDYIDAACARLGIPSPPTGSAFVHEADRSGELSALAHAMSFEHLSGLDDEAFKMILALPPSSFTVPTPMVSRRGGFMQMFIWLYELQKLYPGMDLLEPGVHNDDSWIDPYAPNGIPTTYPGWLGGYGGFNLGRRLTQNTANPMAFEHYPNWSEYYHMATLLYEMLAQYDEGKTTSLDFTYTLTGTGTGILEFSHDGFVPHGTGGHNGYAGIGVDGEAIYDAYLSWPNTAGLLVEINGVPASDPGTGVSVKTTDLIEVTYNGVGEVSFTLVDKQHYLKPNSIQGALLTAGENSATSYPFQHVLTGFAEFVTLKSTLSITKDGGQNILIFKNNKEPLVPRLPDTGGIGLHLFVGMGITTMLLSALLLKRREKRGASTPR